MSWAIHCRDRTVVQDHAALNLFYQSKSKAFHPAFDSISNQHHSRLRGSSGVLAQPTLSPILHARPMGDQVPLAGACAFPPSFTFAPL